MSNTRTIHLPFSPIQILVGTALTLVLVYIALMAMVMTYATLTVNFAQSERDDEAAVAALESSYLTALQSITSTDYVADGYAKPVAQVFVTGSAKTALR